MAVSFHEAFQSLNGIATRRFDRRERKEGQYSEYG